MRIKLNDEPIRISTAQARVGSKSRAPTTRRAAWLPRPKSLAIEDAKRGIRVNAVAPGTIKTISP
jgi:NAD(P)-dependent dehydrogenase (short-subunit alcohol dehydrogenase family)